MLLEEPHVKYKDTDKFKVRIWKEDIPHKQKTQIHK